MTASQAPLPPHTMQCEVCERYHPASSITGVEIQGVYDGVLIWHAPCGHEWPRFLAGPRRDAAERILDRRSAS